MDIEFLSELMDNTGFPAEAKGFLVQAGKTVRDKVEPLFDGLCRHYLAQAAREVEEQLGYGWAAKQCQEEIDRLALETGLSPDTVWLLVLIGSSQPVREDWLRKGREDRLFFETFADLRYKALECMENHGVWGNFVPHWYAIFYTDRIVKLGRLEYEIATYRREEPYEGHGLRLEKGSPVLSIHIPSSGEPFDREARRQSYRLAWEHFSELRQEGKLPCVCHSWLLYPDYAALLPEGSNILDFMADFDVIGKDVTEQFGDDWRLFGPDSKKPLAEWPEKTRMQRALKAYLLQGGKPGYGYGVLAVDEEKVLTRK